MKILHLTMVTFLTASCSLISSTTPGSELDPYGGCIEIAGERTGFFHAQEIDGRWWLVTPDGHGFLSLGINHYHPGWWAVDENRDHWVAAWGAERPSDAAWKKGFRDEAVKDCAHLGLNTFGYHCETEILLEKPLGPVLPYVRQFVPIRFSGHMKPKAGAYVDVFAPSFAEHCDALAQERVRPYANDKLILGYAMADVPTMTDFESSSPWSGGPTWPKVLRNTGSEAPGKQVYVAMMKERHGTIHTFNAAYRMAFDSWEALTAAANWRPKTDMANETEKADNMAFMRARVDRYYRVASEAIRRYDANHMFFGDKWNANSDSFENVADIVASYCDVAYFQCYGEWNYMKPPLDRWSKLTGLPLLNGDSSYGTPKEHMPKPGGTVLPTQAARVAATREFCENAFARPDFVGWHICGILEMWDTMPGQQPSQKIGLKSPTGEWDMDMADTLRNLSKRLYEIGRGEKH